MVKIVKDVSLNVKLKGGGNFVKLSPVFSDDGQFIFIACKGIIYSYNTKTGKRYMEYKGIDKKIIGFGAYTHEDISCLCACSSSGLVIIWKVDTGMVLKKTTIRGPECFKVISKSSDTNRVLKAVTTFQSDELLHIGILNLDTFDYKETNLYIKLFKGKYNMDIGGFCDDLFMAVTFGKNMLYFKLNNTHEIQKVSQFKGEITCVKCHPEHELILTGDNYGRIVAWQNLGSSTPTQALFHWHQLPVNTICFSVSGSMFYSGADECVLVKWDINNTQTKKFLPRMPSYIQHISVANDNLFTAIATSDNSIHIVDSQFSLISNVQHLVMGKKFMAGITFDPRSKSLVMNGIVGHLQFYSPHDMFLLYNLDIIKMNKLTAERNMEIKNVDVTKMSLSRNAMWMVTLEELNDPDPLYYESRLKFWHFNVEKQTFELNTSIETPHDGKTLGIQIQPSTKELGLRCLSIGDDGKFKIWMLVDVTSVYSKGVAWRCAGAAFYRNLIPKASAFSYDGSLMGIAFDNIITTWLPDSLELKCSLIHPKYQDIIKKIAFGSGTQCHIIVSSGKKTLSAWNLLTLSMIWVVNVQVEHLVNDIMLEHMAVFTTKGKLFVFYPHSPDAIYTQQVVDKETRIEAAAFVPKMYISDRNRAWYHNSDLYFIDSYKELYSLDNRESDGSEAIHFLHSDQHKSLFSQILPQVKSNAIELLKPVTHNYASTAGNKHLEQILDSPAQTMVPVRFICGPILKSLILRKNQQVDLSNVNVPSAVVNKVDAVDDVDDYDDLAEVKSESIKWVKSVF